MIQRENASRRIDIGADVSRAATSAPWPATSSSGWTGSSSRSGTTPRCSASTAERQSAQRRLLIFAIGAALVIFLLLQAAFGSWRLAALAFFTLPMALVGGVLAAYAGGGVISLGSLVGFFTVLGIAARNGIMMISHFQHLERHEGEPFGPALVLRGARERLAPILMTALATGLALVPLVLAGDKPGPRDRAPDGDRHPRRPGHLDAAQPVRGPGPVSAVRARGGAEGGGAAGVGRVRVSPARAAQPPAPDACAGVTTTRTPSSRSWSSSTGAGAPVIGSAAARGLRERDDLADRLAGADQRHDAVDAHRDAAVRRRAVLQRVEQEAEPAVGLLLAQPDDLEDLAAGPRGVLIRIEPPPSSQPSTTRS